MIQEAAVHCSMPFRRVKDRRFRQTGPAGNRTAGSGSPVFKNGQHTHLNSIAVSFCCSSSTPGKDTPELNRRFFAGAGAKLLLFTRFGLFSWTVGSRSRLCPAACFRAGAVGCSSAISTESGKKPHCAFLGDAPVTLSFSGGWHATCTINLWDVFPGIIHTHTTRPAFAANCTAIMSFVY